ncbi:MAG: hypothetical protein JW745_04930, partial [Sedimentisphaerales bacterium]|nr:hypothetical protein [Sedimentisphaerales bacterium]
MKYLFKLFLMAGLLTANAVNANTLWQAGVSDNSGREFALGEGKWNDYTSTFGYGSTFIAGHSQASDIPYVLPGTQDSWAGSRSHSTDIVFKLANFAQTDKFQLIIDMAETHKQFPPQLKIEINDSVFVRQTLAGSSDDTLHGNSNGKEFIIDLEVPAGLLKTGNNRIKINNSKGSWIIFDHISFNGPSTVALAEVDPEVTLKTITPTPFVINGKNNEPLQLLNLTLETIGKSSDITITANGQKVTTGQIKAGTYPMELAVPATEVEKTVKLEIRQANKIIAAKDITVPAMRKWEINLIHQTHLDIGYTEPQEDILNLQVQHLYDALDYIDKSKDYPVEAQFKYHPEGMWAVDEFMRRASETDKARLVDAARKKLIHIDVMYAQAMTGGYREEELFELMGSAVRFCKKYGIELNSCTQSDVPGYTWGLVSALAHNGIKYISVGPNGGHRVGHTFYWADKPFYWLGADGKSKVLFWMDGTGYSRFHGQPKGHIVKESEVLRLINDLQKKDYPYDMVMLRYCIERDNGSPNPALSDGVKSWNEKYAWPKLIIARNSDFLADFEKKHGESLPTISGDFTPYWEDGMASTAADTGTNRRTADRLEQAQILWSMLQADTDWQEQFDAAWEKVIMYDEHTWGAWNSISNPDSEFARTQAEYKSRFAQDGARMANNILEQILTPATDNTKTFAVYNTTSWSRSELVTLTPEQSKAGDIVSDENNKPVPSQRLAGGELVFL